MCPLGLRFFGLTQEYRLYLFTQIHDIIFHGNGGFDWDTVYNMPIWLRKFTFYKMKEHYDEKNDNDSSDLISQTKAIREGKIPLPEQFTGRLKQTPKY
jgi:hypothetical protein